MCKKELPEVYKKALEMIDMFCDEGTKHYDKSQDDEAAVYYKHAHVLAKHFSGDNTYGDSFKPMVAKSTYYYGLAVNDETIIYKAVVEAAKWYDVDVFCEFLINTVGRKRLGLSDDGIELLKKYKINR